MCNFETASNCRLGQLERCWLRAELWRGFPLVDMVSYSSCMFVFFFFFVFKQKTEYEFEYGLVGSEMGIGDRYPPVPCIIGCGVDGKRRFGGRNCDLQRD